MLRVVTAIMAFGLASLSVLSQPARAQSSNDEPGFEQGLIRGLLSAMGVIDENKPQIDYRERAPLVVPGNRQALPAPQDPAAIAARNPSWPRDPDQERARLKARNEAEGKKLEMGVLSRSQLASSSAAGAGRVTEPQIDRQKMLGNYNINQVESTTFNGKVSKLFGRDDDQKPVAFTGEPERRSLVEPPKGFRTPSPNAPYGPVGAKVDDKTVVEQRKDDRTRPSR